MTLADEILSLLQVSQAELTDADLADILGKRHQHINQVCRRLEEQGHLSRERRNGVIVNLHYGVAEEPEVASIPQPRSSSERPWDWEGNVQTVLCGWLIAGGWCLIQVSDTASRRMGTDVVAERAGQRLHVEVKGYPSKTYADPRRSHEVKPTQPSLQARHWYAGALLSAIQLRESHPDDRVAIGLPEARRYRSLIQQTIGALRTLRIEIFMVADDGTVAELTRGAGDDAR